MSVTQKRTKILYIITKSVWGGATKYVYDLATGLPDSEFSVYVAAGGNNELATRLKKANIPYYNIKNFQRDVSIFKDIFAFFEILKLLFKTKPDIVHVSSSKAGGIAGVALFFYPAFKVFTVHGWAFAEQRPKRQIKLIKIFSKLTCLFYNKIICVSEFDRNLAIKNKITPTKKLTTIHNGIKPEDYDFLSKEDARLRLDIDHDRLWIGTIGENTKNKGHKYLKEALPESIIIQDLPQGYNYLKAFDIFVLPSIKEGLPYILLEAGLARLPVVATNVGGIPEIIENQKTGLLVNPANPEEIRENVEELINSAELRNRLSFDLWGEINRKFNFNKMLEATIATYQKNT